MTCATGKSARSAPNYDAIADLYQQHWCGHYHAGLVQALERLLLTRLPKRASILDVCCGTGKVARHLAQLGCSVTGIDASAAMLEFAVRDVPEATFFKADARAFQSTTSHDAAICTFDSISYFLTYRDLKDVFRNVGEALKPGGLFWFDLSLEETYRREWQRTCSVVEDDHVFFIRGEYQQTTSRGQTLITSFRRSPEWTRTDVTFHARCWHPAEIVAALRETGFASCEQHNSNDSDWLRQALGADRCCFLASRET